MKQVVVVAGALSVALVSGCLSPVMSIGGKSSHEAQHDTLGKLLPAQLTALGHWTGETRVAKLRVWADDEYRAQNVRWEHGFDEQVDYANQVLIPMLGLRLEPEYQTWRHHEPTSTLDEHMAALARMDPGDDAAFVVGLTSSLSLVSATFDQIGIAMVGGRHLMVRGHADLEERQAFERAFPSIGRDEQETVLEARRRHKTVTVLLHELAHSLGALHETESGWVMNASYSHQAASISDRNRELMLIVLEDRLKPAAARDPQATTRALLAALEVEGGGWDAHDRDTVMASLRDQLGTQPAARPAGIAGAVPAAALDQYQHAEQLFASGDHRGAAATIEPLLAAYPAHADLRVLSCKIELLRGGPKDAKAIATCDRAAGLSAEIAPALAVADARLAAGDAAGSRATLAAAETRLANLPADKAATAWLMLAGRYQAMGALTWAETAIAKAGAAGASPGADHGIAAWAATTRARYGIPRDAGRWKLIPEDEAVAVTTVRGIVALANANKIDAAVKAAGAADRRWPRLPGLLAAHCDLELRRESLAAARRDCDRAIEQGGSSWALYLRGIIELRTDSPAATATAIAKLREAIAIDPELGQAWRALGKALERAKATEPLEQLRRDYQARFRTPLPS